MKQLKDEAQQLIDKSGPQLNSSCDCTFSPIFPTGRDDVCAVRRSVSNGRDYGYDIIYLVWRGPDGNLNYRKLEESSYTKDYLWINSIIAEGDKVTVKIYNDGTFSGKPCEVDRTMSIG